MPQGLFSTKVHIHKSTTFACIASVVLFLVGACSRSTTETVKSIEEGSELPSVRTLDVEQLISDSGYIRYKIITPEWLMYTKGESPYWYFPKGIYMEKFDTAFVIEATVKADTVYYYERENLWKLIGNVDINNLNKDNFKTQLLYWDRARKKVYSDSFIQITRPDRIIEGYGFDSNETMSEYVIRRSSGTFPIDESKKEDSAQQFAPQPEASPPDSLSQAQKEAMTKAFGRMAEGLSKHKEKEAKEKSKQAAP